jgi:ApaG protein
MVKKPIPKSQIIILVETEFIQERSDIEENQYFFSYTVTIKNQGLQSVQLISRHWIINNAHNEKFEVKGEGVIGEQPIIQTRL